MRLTKEVYDAIENAGLSLKELGNTYVLFCAHDAEVFFAGSGTRVLSLFLSASLLSASIAQESYNAACRNAHCVAQLPAKRVRDAVETILMAEAPGALSPLVTAGGFASFGITARVPQLHKIAMLPAEASVRWWAFFYACNLPAQKGAAAFCLADETSQQIFALDSFFNAVLPQTRLALKRLLAKPASFDYAAAIDVFAVFGTKFLPVQQLLRNLQASGEPYLYEHLAISAPQLRVEGIAQRRVGWVMRELLRAVQKEPKLNNYHTLRDMALALASL